MSQYGGWQPIETAPKDGSPILGHAKGMMATVEWFDLGKYWNLCESDGDDGEWNPTHWMPLPDPPSEKSS